MAWLSPTQLQAFARVGRGVKVSSEAVIYGARNIELGDNVRIDAQTLILASSGSLKIGSHVHIAARCLLSCRGGISIGDFCGLSFGVTLISASDDFSGNWLVGPVHPEYLTNVVSAPIRMHAYSVVGAGSIIMPGAELEMGAVLGAGSFLEQGQSLKEWSIAVGRPARHIKTREQEIVKKSMDALQYWDLERFDDD